VSAKRNGVVAGYFLPDCAKLRKAFTNVPMSVDPHPLARSYPGPAS
jgi:hypothetical protein